ncbi:MAG: hypothetical protein LR015_09350 [Verrucomicrobia bacterium]|nr:hypothetical protein [Verrucomicrobiota bacterium]
MILGIVAAFIYLAIQPVPQLTAGQMQTMQPLPKVYFFRGIEAPSADYGRLRRELPNAQTGRFSVSEGDLNTWLRSELLPSMSRADSAISPVTFWGFTATQPNFRVTGDTVIFSVVWQGKDQKGGDPRKIIHQIHWSVDEDGEHWHISGGYIGQFPLKLCQD